MKSRPCGSVFGSVRPSLSPGVCRSVENRVPSGLGPSAEALNFLADLGFGLYAITIEVPAYGMYHLVNFGSSGVMLSPPTDSKTFGLISPAAMSDESVPEALPVPENPAPVAAVKAGLTTFSLRNCSDEA